MGRREHAAHAVDRVIRLVLVREGLGLGLVEEQARASSLIGTVAELLEPLPVGADEQFGREVHAVETQLLADVLGDIVEGELGLGPPLGLDEIIE